MTRTQEEIERSVRQLTYRVDALQAQLTRVVKVLVVMPTVALVLLSVFADAFGEADENGQDIEDGAQVSLRGLVFGVGDGDVESATVRTLATLTLVVLLVVLALVVASTVGDRGWVSVAAMLAAGLLTLLWLVLMMAVDRSDGGGLIRELAVEPKAPAWWPLATAVVAATGVGLVRSGRTSY